MLAGGQATLPHEMAHASWLRRARARLAKPAVHEAVVAYVLLVPVLVGILVFSLGATLASLGISFADWSLTGRIEWVGAANYARMLRDPLFWKALSNTTWYVLGTVAVGIPLALFTAVAMNQKIRGMGIYRTIYFLPVVSSTVAVALLWSWLYASDYGILNWLLARVGLPGVPWLASPRWALPSIMIMSIWRYLGYDATIFLAGLQSVPEELYEAAKIDGAGTTRLFRHVTLPLMSPVIFFVVVLSFINAYQVFGEAYIMTRGGPLNSTTTIVYYIFQWAFQRFSMGYASALGYALFVIILALTLVQFRLEGRWVHYD